MNISLESDSSEINSSVIEFDRVSWMNDVIRVWIAGRSVWIYQTWIELLVRMNEWMVGCCVLCIVSDYVAGVGAWAPTGALQRGRGGQYSFCAALMWNSCRLFRCDTCISLPPRHVSARKKSWSSSPPLFNKDLIRLEEAEAKMLWALERRSLKWAVYYGVH